jgi:hypothetical protein
VSSKEQAQASSAKSVSDLIERWGITTCGRDQLGSGQFNAFSEATFNAKLVQALPANSSCEGGCPFGQPLCKGTLGCVRPSCDDFKPLCNDNTDTGALARFVCGVTCGCDSPTSALLWTGPNSGCLPACEETARSKARRANCSDVQLGSVELAALVTYSRAFERNFPGESSTNASVRAALGCFAVNFDKLDQCDNEFWNRTSGAKSLVAFCPFSCGCTQTASQTGCPETCSLPAPPTIRDLSNEQLSVANNFASSVANSRMERWDPYPASCQDLNTTACDGLLTVRHKHPCPVACDASTSSARPPPPPLPPPRVPATTDTQHSYAKAAHATLHAPPSQLLMSAEAYVWGHLGRNECPEYATRIDSEEACRRAAATMGAKWGPDPRNRTEFTSGCVFWIKEDGSKVYFSAQPVGSGFTGMMQLCVVGTAQRHSGWMMHH